ncbi:MAG: amino acid carrier protein [Flavobacteriales bacterium]
MKKYLLTPILLGFVFLAQSQIKANLEFVNLTDDINDVKVWVNVEEGVKPFRYHWSDKNTSIYADTAFRQMEGSVVFLKLFDASGDSIYLSIDISANSVVEKMNAAVKPMVDFVALGFFWDPFSTMGIYDPVIKNDSVNIISPFGKDEQYTNLRVAEWLVNDGEQVTHNQLIAKMTSDRGQFGLYAVGNGVIRIDNPAGEDATYKFVAKDGKERQRGKVLCTILYDRPFPATTPNGAPISQSIPFVVVWLVLGATFFTIRMKFINFRGVKHALDLVRGKYSDPNDKGEVSHFQALTTALSATVGLGNIAGVAVAVTLGGAGATFWMIVAGLLGMASKFTECTLGLKYREINEEGEVSGGPMYYLKKGLAKKGMPVFGKVLAILFAVLCIGGSFGGGNMFQANQAFTQLSRSVPGLEGHGLTVGIILALLVGVVIIGGIKSIARVTDKIVPFMVTIYVVTALAIIFMNIGYIGEAFSEIISGAFSPTALKGGVIGVLIVGFQRAAFSNEAGVGSASIAHSASKTNEPVSEGVVALLEPFIDTVVVCTMTALVLIFTGFAEGGPDELTGSELTSQAFTSIFGWFEWILLIAIVLFAFSTMVSWSYYGLKAWTYLFGNSKVMDIAYKVLFLLFVCVGASVSLGAVIDFSDMMILGMAFPNVLGLIFLSTEVKKDLGVYWEKLKSGNIKKHK